MSVLLLTLAASSLAVTPQRLMRWMIMRRGRGRNTAPIFTGDASAFFQVANYIKIGRKVTGLLPREEAPAPFKSDSYLQRQRSQNTNNSYGAISDLKLKENIVDASSQWDDLKALQVRNYNFKEGQTHTQIGLVAQE
jgi:hypothetical protein